MYGFSVYLSVYARTAVAPVARYSAERSSLTESEGSRDRGYSRGEVAVARYTVEVPLQGNLGRGGDRTTECGSSFSVLYNCPHAKWHDGNINSEHAAVASRINSRNWRINATIRSSIMDASQQDRNIHAPHTARIVQT